MSQMRRDRSKRSPQVLWVPNLRVPIQKASMTELTSAIYLTDEHTELLIILFYRWNLRPCEHYYYSPSF